MEQQLQFSESHTNKYNRTPHSVGIVMLHLQWCTKYRYRMFRKLKYKNLISACIRRTASRNKIKIIELEVEPEHVHCVVEVNFAISTSKVLQILKGGSAKLFFEYAEKTRLRYPRGHLWSRGKFASSIGFIQFEQVTEYVRNQAEHHQTVFRV